MLPFQYSLFSNNNFTLQQTNKYEYKHNPQHRFRPSRAHNGEHLAA